MPTTSQQAAARRPTKRQAALNAMRFAGYHADGAAYVRLLIESRVARPAADATYTSGRRARDAGMRCGCLDCAAAGGAK